MSRYVFLMFFFFSIVPKSFSQTEINDFSYVIVPEQWSFLNKKDEFQLNSIAKFLFNKHGFNALFSHEASMTRRCDGLYAELVKVPGLIRTKLVVVLKDCNDFEVYRSSEGTSKFKQYRKAYQEALRKVFAQFDNMVINQKEISFAEEISSDKVPTDVNGDKIEESKAEVEIEKTTITPGVVISKLPETKYSSYGHKGLSYLLRKTPDGYSLYQESSKTSDELLLIGNVEINGEGKVSYTDTVGKKFNASFDAAKNLVIQKGNVSEVYKKID